MTSKRILITGGAGFVGVNAASHFATRGWKITLLDNFSRPGVERNLVGRQQALQCGDEILSLAS